MTLTFIVKIKLEKKSLFLQLPNNGCSKKHYFFGQSALPILPTVITSVLASECVRHFRVNLCCQVVKIMKNHLYRIEHIYSQMAQVQFFPT